MTVRPRRISLGWRVLGLLILGEVLFALLLSATIVVFSTVAIANQREESVRAISSLLAASVMPTVAEQEAPQVQAQVANVLDAASIAEIQGICIVDGSGAEIACTSEALHDAAEAQPSRAPWAPLTETRVVAQPIVVDGLQVASVRVQFAPPGLLPSLAVPLLAAAIVLAAIMLVSVPWTAYRIAHDVIEPVDALAEYASRIAQGDLDTSPGMSAHGEIGELQEALGSMAGQLLDRDRRLKGSLAELSEAYRSLERAKGEIEQLARIKEDFVAVAAHELRGPLATIRLYAELLEAGELGVLDERAAGAVEAINSASSRLTSITSDLMDAALLERGLLPIQFSDVWLEQVIVETVRDARARARTRSVRIALAEHVPDAVVSGDALRLRQVFDNLLSNAIKHSPENSEVVVSVTETDSAVIAEVADHGCGIPDAGGDRLFSLFGRLDSGDSRDTAGLGLGLAISARIVEAHNGRVTYRANEQGQGSVFSVRLPLRSSPEARSGTTTISTRGDGDHR